MPTVWVNDNLTNIRIIVPCRNGHTQQDLWVSILERALFCTHGYAFRLWTRLDVDRTTHHQLAETIIDKAIALKAIGGVYGNQKPTEFLCLLLKLLQIQPEKEILIEYLQADEFKCVISSLPLCACTQRMFTQVSTCLGRYVHSNDIPIKRSVRNTRAIVEGL